MKRQSAPMKPRINPGVDKEIIFENGWRGVFSVAGNETQELSLWDLEIAGKKFACTPKTRNEFVEFLAGITEPEVNVMWMYSSETKFSPLSERRKKKKSEPIIDEKSETIHYNCTICVPKPYVQPMFDDVSRRAEEFVKFIAELAIKQYERDLADKSCEI